jgi:flagellar biosynthesis protein
LLEHNPRNNKTFKNLVVNDLAESKNEDGARVDIVAGADPEISADNGDQNPQAKAVALREESESGARPRVLASGRGAFAEQILQIAWANDIKVREDADLVEILSAIDVDSEIPIEAFAAVAEILSYVYRANTGLINIEEPEDSAE